MTSFVERRGVSCEVVEHEATYSAVAEARAVDAEPEAPAKTVALRDRDGYRLAVVPASERATCAERATCSAPASTCGALPPFGTAPLPEAVDVRLLHHKRLVCAGGEQRRFVRIDMVELMRVTEPRVADICGHPEERQPVDGLPSL